jgi:hypothetical protein
MKKEHEERLNKMREFFVNYDDILDDDFYRRRLEFDDHLEVLAATKDTEILEYLMDFFDEEFDCEVDEACEILKSRIGANFTLNQIIEAFYKKFNTVAESYFDACVEMSMWCIRNRQIDDGHWDRFREMFNTVKSKHSPRILEKLKTWFNETWSTWTDEEKAMVYALEEDMKKW